MAKAAKKMSKSAVTSAMADKVDITKKQAALFLEELASLAYKEAKNSFTLPGLGKLVLVNRKARMGRNPATGEAIKHREHRTGSRVLNRNHQPVDGPFF